MEAKNFETGTKFRNIEWGFIIAEVVEVDGVKYFKVDESELRSYLDEYYYRKIYGKNSR